MNELNDFLKIIAEGKQDYKQNDPIGKKLEEVKENVKTDIDVLFSQLFEIATQEPIFQPTHEEVGIQEQIVEAAPFPVPKTEKDSIKAYTTYFKNASFQQPDVPRVDPTFKAIQDKLKFLEQWVGKISVSGPGGGEVNLRWLDDVDRSTIDDGLFLRYSSAKKKFEFADPQLEDNDTAYLTEEVDTLDSVTTRGNTTDNEISVHAVNIPVGSLISGDSKIVANITTEQLNAILEHGDSANLSIGDYGLPFGITGGAYTVYGLVDVPSPALQVNDIIGGASIPVESSILYVGSGIYDKIIITNKNFAVGAVLPVQYTQITFARPIVNAGLSISTLADTDITLNSGAGGNIVTHSDILPYSTNIWSLGSPGKRFKEIWFGTGTIYVQDETLGNDQALGAKDGNFYISGGAGLEVGGWTLRDNYIYIKDPARNVNIGELTDTASVTFNRPINVQTSAQFSTFSVTKTGRVQINTPNISGNDPGALLINASTDGSYQPVIQAGGLLHLVGPDGGSGNSAKFNFESYGSNVNYAPLLNARRARGTAASPQPVQNNDVLFRLAATGWSGTNYNESIALAWPGIEMVATENYTTSAFGSVTNIYAVKNGTTSRVLSGSFTGTGLTFSGSTGITFNNGDRLTYFPDQTNKAEKFLKVTNVGGDYVMSWEATPVVTGAVVYKGLYVVSTNTPPITDATGTAGWEYTVSGSGTVNFGFSDLVVQDGDLLIHNGTHYDLIPGPRTQVNSDWNATTGVAAILNKPDFKTVNGNSILGTGNVSVGTVTSIGGTGTVSGITLTGSISTTGNLTLGGSIDKISSSVFGIGKVDGTTISATGGVISSLITQGITDILPHTLDSSHHIGASITGTVATIITDATTSNTPNTIVLRDSNGNIDVSAWTINTHLTEVNYTATATDYWIGVTVKKRTITLPASAQNGRQYYIVDAGTTAGNPDITITAPVGTTVIGGSLSQQNGQRHCVYVSSTNTWYCT